MQRKLEDGGRRDRISVSLDPEDYDWIRSFDGPSDSFTISRIIKAARLQGLTLESATTGGVLEDFAVWLTRKRKNRLAADLARLISEYLSPL